MKFIEEVVDILDLLYQHGWDERNGGNLSYILTDEEAKIFSDSEVIRTFKYNFDMTEVIGKYFVITGTGKYFKNCKKDPETNLGVLRVIDNETLGLVWGYKDGGRPTSESPTHLRCHLERLKKDSDHRLVIHCHPTNLIAMTFVHELDDNKFTKTLWKMQTESIVVFPEGVAVLPWMLCGGDEIGVATCEKMKDYRSVVWAHHGLFATGTTLDEVYGLIETIEKACEIYLKIYDKKIVQYIKDDELKILADSFKVDYKKGIID